MEKMTITRALAELKLLDSRINKAISGAFLVDVSQKKTENGSKAIKSGMTKEAFEQRANSSYKSINDLINRRNQIKSAVLNSNATTKVIIGGNEYTVVEAIDQKIAIEYKTTLLTVMKQQLSTMKQEIDRVKSKVEDQVESMLSQNLGANKKTSESDYETIAKPFIEANELKLIDPLQLQDKIDQLDKEIDEFVNEVDFVLSESNSRTEIEF